ncbi:MAG: hypothetical protein J0H01_14180 [Rhizobiales bacterium]|nr:hypothetical protein [Hyphomicrobiales bacterium]
MINIPETAIGAVVASLIAGTVSLLGLIISKEQKVSEFRQAWIDALRSELTTYLTQINAIHDAVKVKYDNHAKKVEKLGPLFVSLNSSNFNILLRVNHKEVHSAALIEAMKKFNIITSNEEHITVAKIREAEGEFIKASQALLKQEWRRVKSGEITFRVAKWLAVLVVLASLAFGGVASYRIWWPVARSSVQVTVS